MGLPGEDSAADQAARKNATLGDVAMDMVQKIPQILESAMGNSSKGGQHDAKHHEEEGSENGEKHHH